MSKRGLGRGLGALIAGITDSQEIVRELQLGDIVPNPQQPRKHFDAATLAELAESIRVHGILQPLVVRPRDDGRHELVAGERRWRAAQTAGLAEVPVVVLKLSDRQAMEIALIENLQRADLTPLETAHGLKQLAEGFELTHDELSQRVGMSRSAVTNALRLLTLPAAIHALLATGRISAGHARALIGCADKAWQLAIAERVEPEGLSVRTVEQLVQAGKRPKPTAKAKPTVQAPAVNRLGVALGTAVKLRQSGDKGAIEIAFASTAQRDTLLALLSDRLVR